jgi:hypothetical protein
MIVKFNLRGPEDFPVYVDSLVYLVRQEFQDQKDQQV